MNERPSFDEAMKAFKAAATYQPNAKWVEAMFEDAMHVENMSRARANAAKSENLEVYHMADGDEWIRRPYLGGPEMPP